jgi:hypothetical protein
MAGTEAQGGLSQRATDAPTTRSPWGGHRMVAEGVMSPTGAPAPPRSRRFPTGEPAFELLESKLRGPQARGGTVHREALIRSLEEAAARPVVFVCAGPGWGKTTLLAQWALASPRRFAWVSTDESDSDPIVVLTYVAAALHGISPLEPRSLMRWGRPESRWRARSYRGWEPPSRRCQRSSSWSSTTFTSSRTSDVSMPSPRSRDTSPMARNSCSRRGPVLRSR